MNRRLRFIVFFVVMAVVVFAWGEGKSKKEKLRDYYRQTQEDMREAYDNGDLEKVIRLYRDNCLKNGKEKKTFKKMSKEIRTGIYQLVLRSYTALDRPDLGDVFLRKLLVLRREEGTGDYWLSIRNTAQAKYIVAPRLLVGLTAGANFSRVRPGTRYSILEVVSDTGVNHDKEYDFHFKHSRGTQLGIIIEYSLTRRFSLVLQPALTTLKFQYNNRVGGEDEEVEVETDYEHRQRLNYIEIPLLLKYQLGKSKKFKPYLQIGGFFRIKTTAFKSIALFITEPGVTRYPKMADSISIENQIAKYNGGFLIGAGIRYNIRDIHLALEVNYKHAFNNIVNEAGRWGNSELIYHYYDVFDDMKVKSLDVSFKVLFPISFKAFRK